MNESLDNLKKRIINEVSLCSTSKEAAVLFIAYIKHELNQYSSIKEQRFLKELSIEDNALFDMGCLDKNNLVKEEYISLENAILGVLDLFFEIDIERKEFETARILAILKARLLSPFIESNELLMVEFGFEKEKVAQAKRQTHPAYDYFYNLKR